jgi:hypothetical protein
MTLRTHNLPSERQKNVLGEIDEAMVQGVELQWKSFSESPAFKNAICDGLNRRMILKNHNLLLDVLKKGL